MKDEIFEVAKLLTLYFVASAAWVMILGGVAWLMQQLLPL